MKPVVQIGKNGMTDQLVQTVELALTAHELIKVKFIEFQDEKDEISEEVAQRTTSHRVGMVGNIVMLYREHPEPDKRKIKLPSVSVR